MLSLISRKFWLSLFLVVVIFVFRARAERSITPVRYHFGDDLRWANPNLDDSAWAIAQAGRWPVPPFNSDGFVWVRVQVRVRSDASGPLAIRSTDRSSRNEDLSATLANEIFVNGRPVGMQGSFPPHPVLSHPARETIFELPADLVMPGETAIVAFRSWYPPFAARPRYLASESFAIDETRNVQLAIDSERSATLLSDGPDLVLNLLITLMGIGLFVFWRSAGGRELLLSSGVLIIYPVFSAFFVLSQLGIVLLPWRVDSLLKAIWRLMGEVVIIEFVWTIHGLRSLVVKRLVLAIALIRNALPLIAQFAVFSLLLVHWSILAIPLASIAYGVIVGGANLWAIFTRKQNRLIAGALLLVNVTSLQGWFGGIRESPIGALDFSYFNVAYFLAGIALCVTLGRRAWAAWRGREELRAELEAAREVQQQLVTPAVDIPGFRIESAYIPARQVGGDFFRVVPEDGSGVLIVVGDVSGKGLRAAMTVAAVVGALRTIHPVSPAWIIGALNSGLVGNLHGGFVTCCAARITQDGSVTIANAGHLSPYRSGAEMELAAGLPLGIDPNTEYKESQFKLAPGESLTFVSDGIVEARNAAGELFGFERTLKISSSNAETIAQAAVAFGQEDDITVLSLSYAGVPASA